MPGRRSLWLFLVALLAASTSLVHSAPPASPPRTRTEPVKETLHGVEIVDPYRWLEDQKSPETRAWIKAQNEYTQSFLHVLPGREELKSRLTRLLRTDSVGSPVERGGRYFFTKRAGDQELSILCVRKGLRGEDEVLIDPHFMSPDHTLSIRPMGFSQDGTLLAYGIRRGGEDEVEVRLFDVDQRKDLPDRLPKGRISGVSIKNDKSGFYYSRYDNKIGPRVYYHEMGEDPTSDAKIFGKDYGIGKIIGAELSDDNRYLLIRVSHGSSGDQTEIYCQDLANDGPILPIVNDIKARFSADIAGEKLYLTTNWQAPNSRVLLVDLNKPEREYWREVIPMRTSPLRSVVLAGGRVFAHYLEDVSTRIQILDPKGKHLADLKLPGIGSAFLMGRWERNEAFYGFSSFHTPGRIYRYDVATGEQELWHETEVPVDTDAIEVQQVWFESRDKTRVPMFLVHKKGLKLDGSNPTMLTGYGGFNASMTPRFSAIAALWAEKGGVFAVPNLRGGGEFGEEWHKAGMLEKKQNVFNDFIAAAEWLIENKYTSPEKLAISGGSNGGLLVGAAMTQRPELFRAVVCSVPLLDMVRYHKFLVARFWVPEYGSSEDPEQFKYLYAYSPYHRVKEGTLYPATLFITGDADTRVDPLHARKMCALLQSATGSGPDRPVLLHYDTKAGHSGGKPISKTIEDETDELSFLFWQLGMGE